MISSLGTVDQLRVEQYVLLKDLGRYTQLAEHRIMMQLYAHITDNNSYYVNYFTAWPGGRFLCQKTRKQHVLQISEYWETKISITVEEKERRKISAFLKERGSWIISATQDKGLANKLFCIKNLHDISDPVIFEQLYDYYGNA